MSVYADLAERRQRVIARATAIAKAGVDARRDLTAEEEAEFDGLIAEAETLQKRLDEIRESEQRSHELEDSFYSATGRTPGGYRSDGRLGEWARGARIGDHFDLAPVTGAEMRAVLTRGRGIEQRAMSATGGVGPDGVYGTLWEYAVAGSQLLQAGVFILNTTDGNTLPLPRATVHSTAAATNPNVPIGESDATINTVNLSVAKQAYLTLVPNELIEDASFDLEGYLARAAGRELGIKIAAAAATALIAGFTVAGKTGPTGTATSFGTQTTAGEGGDLLIDLFHSVLPEYRANASWVMADATAAMIRKIKGTDGEYMWARPLVVGDPVTIEGRPLYIDPSIAVPAANAKSIYFGDFSGLAVRIAGGIRFERSADYAFGNDQVAFRAKVRAGAVVVDPNAVHFFAHSAA